MLKLYICAVFNSFVFSGVAAGLAPAGGRCCRAAAARGTCIGEERCKRLRPVRVHLTGCRGGSTVHPRDPDALSCLAFPKPCPADPARAALQYLSLGQVTLAQLAGVVLPSLALYRMEARMRRAFVRSCQGGCGGGQAAAAPLAALARPTAG